MTTGMNWARAKNRPPAPSDRVVDRPAREWMEEPECIRRNPIRLSPMTPIKDQPEYEEAEHAGD